MTKKILLCVVSLCMLSCVSKKDIVYFQNIETIGAGEKKYEPTIQYNDQLAIFVTSPTPEAAMDFNMVAVGVVDENAVDSPLASQIRFQTYLVDTEGNIQFPVLGNVKVAGLTRSETIALLKLGVEKYIKNPTITLRINNYKISVLGEVNRPGSFPVTSERITLPEALSLAGDLTIYGERKTVLVIREANGVKTYNYVDLTSADFFSSPYYYLTQNDVVYITPNKTRVNSAAIGPNTTIIISAVSLLITVVAIVIR